MRNATKVTVSTFGAIMGLHILVAQVPKIARRHNEKRSACVIHPFSDGPNDLSIGPVFDIARRREVGSIKGAQES